MSVPDWAVDYVARPTDQGCPYSDWYAGRCELVRGHSVPHFARWYGTGDAGYATWQGDKNNERETPEPLCGLCGWPAVHNPWRGAGRCSNVDFHR